MKLPVFRVDSEGNAIALNPPLVPHCVVNYIGYVKQCKYTILKVGLVMWDLIVGYISYPIGDSFKVDESTIPWIRITIVVVVVSARLNVFMHK